MASTIEGLSDQLPTLTLELSKNAVDTMIKFLIGASENLKNAHFGLMQGMQAIIKDMLSKFLDPIIWMLSEFQPSLEEAKRIDSKIKLIPDEFIVFIKGIQKNAKEGKGSQAERIVANIFNDIYNALENATKPGGDSQFILTKVFYMLSNI